MVKTLHFTVWGMGSIPGSKTKILSAVRHSQFFFFFFKNTIPTTTDPFHALSSFYPPIV